MSRACRRIVIALLCATVIAACTSQPEGPGPPADDGTIRVGAFNFPESKLLAELYAQALKAHDFPVSPVAELGSREIVAPALEQGRIDLVPEYTGSALNFLSRDPDAAEPDTRATHAALAAAAKEHGVTVGAAARAQNQNAFAVTAENADQLGLETLSDLGPVAGKLVFGGPPECPERPTCLPGLQQHYDLEFERFVSIGRSVHVAAALTGGEIDVGLLFTTDPAIAANELVVLDDDRALQPAENVAPVVRTAVLERHGDNVLEVLDEVSAQLTTEALAELNREVEMEGATAADAAGEWLRDQGLTP